MRDLSNENIVHIQKEEGNMIRFRRLEEYPEIRHCFTLKPLDFMSSHEAASKEADKWLSKELGIPEDSLCKPQQTHSDHIRVVGQKGAGILLSRLQDTDGLVTKETGLALLLTFADCTPLLFYDPVKKVIADIHSGWRGTLARIGSKCILLMKEKFRCDPADLICCIGPHIHKCCFEVDRDVEELFREEFRDFDKPEDFISYDRDKNKYFIDTLYINRRLMLNAGLKQENIIDSGICTVCSCGICHSYRADREKSGRSASVIALI